MMMRKGKRFLWVLLGLTLTLALYCSAATAESGTWGKLNWSLNSSGVLTISGTGAMNDLESVHTNASTIMANKMKPAKTISSLS